MYIELTAWEIQVLTVHSPFRIENCTNKPLEFVVHLFLAPNLQDALPAMRNSASTNRVPSSGPLLPGLQCYLPAPAIWYSSSAPRATSACLFHSATSTSHVCMQKERNVRMHTL